MSRSAMNVFSGLTWSAGTPAISSMISLSPVRISCCVMAMSRTLPHCVGCVLPATRLGRRSGYRDHLRRIADASAEADQERLVAGGDLTPLDHPGKRQRDRRG